MACPWPRKPVRCALPAPNPPSDVFFNLVFSSLETGAVRGGGGGKVQRSAEKFAKEVLAPRVVLQNRRGTFDRSIITEMGRAGLLGCTLQGYGCAGLGHVAYGLVARYVTLCCCC